MAQVNSIIHIALPTGDKQRSMTFYQNILKLPVVEMAESEYCVDFYGNNITFHEVEDFILPHFPTIGSKDGSLQASAFHIGVIMEKKAYENAIDNLYAEKVALQTKPNIANLGTEHEQRFCFFHDPDGYAIELKQTKTPFKFSKLARWSLQNKNREHHYASEK